jgi:tripeptide aminopeptidase
MARFSHSVTDRFLRYVTIDTQSSPSSKTFPSTEKQKDLGRLVAQELRELGIADAHLDEHGYVYGTLPANSDKAVPVICFCAHMDTSPDCSGKDVKPQLVRNYQGGDITLLADPSQVIRVADNPALKDQTTTSSPPTAPRCSAPTTRPASPRSWTRSRSCCRARRSATAR